MNRVTLAAIDIGSNAIRILINFVESSEVGSSEVGSSEVGSSDTHTQNCSVAAAPRFKKAAFVRVPLRLGEDVFTLGSIGPEKRLRLIEAMHAFRALLTTFRTKEWRACATSAMREASNSSEIIATIARQCDINIEIISGQEEAETIFEAGDIAGLMAHRDTYLYLDVGGGSSEVTLYSTQERVASESVLLGTVRALSSAEKPAELKRFKRWLVDVAKPHNPTSIIGSGGNINKVRKLLKKRDNEAISYNELKALHTRIKELTTEERQLHLQLNSYRADVIEPALKIFTTAAKCCNINKIVVPRIGLADGIIHQIATKMGREQ